MNLFLGFSVFIGCFSLILSFFMMLIGIELFSSQLCCMVEWDIFSLGGVLIKACFLFDQLSILYGGVVMLISGVVFIYSSVYLAGDVNFRRFILLVILFVGSMFLMIFSPNLISILLGWDGLGLVSYCLVIYYQNVKSNSAGMITILSNRVGDLAILISISWLLNFGDWNFIYFSYLVEDKFVLLVFGLVMIAAMTKSAQVPFSAWLPAAMAAPTPVSSLVHSSTLVTAGVYLMIRFSSFLEMNLVLLTVGILTLFMSGLGANFEMDLSKVIALSTLSQLGFMMLGVSIGMSELAYFHMVTHALFKSLLFLCAGIYIHSNFNSQNVMLLGGLGKMSPVVSLFFMVSSLSLCGFPFLGGFYSKDLLLLMFLPISLNFVFLFMVMTGVFFTICYSVRLVLWSYFSGFKGKSFLGMGENLVMLVPMSFLFIMAVSGGSIFSWVFITPSILYMIGNLGLVMLLALCLLPFLVYQKMFLGNGMFSGVLLEKWFSLMWGLSILTSWMFIPLLGSSIKTLKSIDQGWLELLGSQGVYGNFMFVVGLFENFIFKGLSGLMLLFMIMVLFLILII
uniref:NADH-ubiquinone oxidoreductase chain 5 n=1 Tax=Neelides sp. FZ-2019 TaxID=2583951 RepID=A0A6H0EWQ1_9HEXA|nr:NADH dehydrogenase subunit 5 [Neelides sp. FZ-2019]